jgi:hypothetical protein
MSQKNSLPGKFFELLSEVSFMTELVFRNSKKLFQISKNTHFINLIIS